MVETPRKTPHRLYPRCGRWWNEARRRECNIRAQGYPPRSRSQPISTGAPTGGEWQQRAGRAITSCQHLGAGLVTTPSSPSGKSVIAVRRISDPISAISLSRRKSRRSSRRQVGSASCQSRDRDVGPNQSIENEKNALRVLQLKERGAVRISHGFDPEDRGGC